MVMGCLAGCTSNDQTVENEKNTSETEQAESGEKTVITVARWGTDSEKEAFENICNSAVIDDAAYTDYDDSLIFDV